MGLSQTDFELEDSKWLYQSNQNCVNTLDSKSIQDTERNMLELTLKLSSLSTKKLNVNLKKKKNPRKIAWTSVYRQLHRKGIQEETKRRRVRKQKRIIRSVVGISVEDIKRKRKPEQHAALRDAAIRARKEKVKGNKNKGKKGGNAKRAKQPKQPKQKGSSKGGR